jgi:hypothetical protein
MSKETKLFIGYTQGFFIDPHVVISTSSGAASTYEYCLQPFDDGRLRYLQPWWMVAF